MVCIVLCGRAVYTVIQCGGVEQQGGADQAGGDAKRQTTVAGGQLHIQRLQAWDIGGGVIHARATGIGLGIRAAVGQGDKSIAARVGEA